MGTIFIKMGCCSSSPEGAKPNSNATVSQPPAEDLSESEVAGKRILELTNEFRAEEGLPALGWDKALHDLCKQHADNMLAEMMISHNGVSERFNQWNEITGKQWCSQAENVAM